MSIINIRVARPDDAGAIREIYRYYVENTAVTYDCETPAEAEFRRRITATLEAFPYFTAEKDGVIAGYAYAGKFHARPAYGRCAELSIYISPEARRCGLGAALYGALEDTLRRMGYLNLYACIASPVEEDEYLTRDSERFHERMGFEKIGEFHLCGFKFSRWYNMIWMEKLIGSHCTDEPPVQLFSSLPEDRSLGFLQEPRK